jgi:hypothetical protein
MRPASTPEVAQTTQMRASAIADLWLPCAVESKCPTEARCYLKLGLRWGRGHDQPWMAATRYLETRSRSKAGESTRFGQIDVLMVRRSGAGRNASMMPMRSTRVPSSHDVMSKSFGMRARASSRRRIGLRGANSLSDVKADPGSHAAGSTRPRVRPA